MLAILIALFAFHAVLAGIMLFAPGVLTPIDRRHIVYRITGVVVAIASLIILFFIVILPADLA